MGRMEGWKNGRMEGWKNGRLEDWGEWKNGENGKLIFNNKTLISFLPKRHFFLFFLSWPSQYFIRKADFSRQVRYSHSTCRL